MIRRLLLAALIPAALAGCSREPEPEPTPLATGAAEPAPASPTAVATPAAPPPRTIPAAMRGRFGLVPADCTTTRGDDKGLVTVRADGLRFYESVARLAEPVEVGARAVKGKFAYSGEGMEWQREASLRLSDDGRTLVIEEFGADAVEGPLTYTRCAT